MPQEPYRNPKDAHTDILTKIGFRELQEAPMCGTEEYRDGSKKNIVSFDCYAVSLRPTLKRNVDGHDTIPFGCEPSNNVATSLSSKEKTLIISNFHHRKREEKDSRMGMDPSAGRYVIFGSRKRKYTPGQRSDLIVEMSDKTMEREECFRSAYRMTRAVLASMLETHGVQGAEVDFVMMDNFSNPISWEREFMGIALMCNNTFVTSFAFGTDDNECVLLTHCIHDGGADAIQERIPVEGSTAKDVVRHLTPALLKIVETAGK